MQVRATYPTLVERLFPRASAWRDVALVAGASLWMALCAQITVYLPGNPVPISVQSFGMLLAAALLGSRLGSAAMVLYLLEGAAGLPVFTPGGAPGVARFLGPTAGYLLAYPFAAFAIGYLAERGWDRSWWRLAVALGIGTIIVYIFGVGVLSFHPLLGKGLVPAVVVGMLPFLPGDLIKLVLAAAVVPSGWAVLGPRRR